MQCPHCGKEVKEDSKFCKSCGKALEESKKSEKKKEETLEKEEIKKEKEVSKTEDDKPKSHKNMIILIVSISVAVLLIIAVAVAIWFGSMRPKKEPIEQNKVEEVQEKNYLEKYQDYFEEEGILEEDDIEGVLIDFEKDKEPELVLKYLNDRKQSTLKILSLHGDEVRESEEYPLYFLSILYDVENEDYAYYIETKDYEGVEYLPILDIISEKSDIEEIEDKDENHEYDIDDEEFNYTYIKATITVDMYTISEKNLESDLKRLDKKYKEEKSYVSSSEEERIQGEIQNIKDNNLEKDSTKISNKNYSVQYGTYAYGDYLLVLNNNGSASLSKVFTTGNYDTTGSFTLYYDQLIYVRSNGDEYRFKIVGNNQLKGIKGDLYFEIEDAIWNLK